jgi:shikimate 5-dehydrogenase/3-dehydroquinate dehydratase
MLIVSIFKLQDYTDQLKNLGADLVELRLDLMSSSDLDKLLSLNLTFNLDLILTLKPRSLPESVFLTLCTKLQPAFIDLDMRLYPLFEKKLKKLLPKTKLILSKHTPHMYELDKFYKKYKPIKFKKLVIETNNTYLGLKIALKAQKEHLILFAAGEHTSFTRFFSAWHYCFVSVPTGAGQFDLMTLNRLYTTYSCVKKFYALIGNPVSASLSHITHNALLKTFGKPFVYFKFSLKQSSLKQSLELIKALGAQGLSVTTPFKKVCAKLYKAPSKSINTICFKQKKTCNTDASALLELIKDKPKSVLILGDGACAQSFMKALPHSIQWARKHKTPLNPFYSIIVNATSSCDPLEHLPRCSLLINLFRQQNAAIEQKALSQGSQVIHGHTFFYTQALHQWNFWLQKTLAMTDKDFFKPTLEL